jgi:glycine cleavage system H protein
MRYYTKNDEWIDVDGNEGILGITKENAKNLGEVSYVELPKIGKDVAEGDALCTIESVKAAIDYYAPMSGEVLAVNDALEDQPELLSERPEEVWIAMLKLTDPSEAEELMDEEEYLEYKDEDSDFEADDYDDDDDEDDFDDYDSDDEFED